MTGAPWPPDAERARDLLLDELARSEYAAAQPTWFDLLWSAVLDWLASLTLAGSDTPPVLVIAIFAGLLAVIVAVAFLVAGRPRRAYHSVSEGALLGDTESRTADELRADARAAADRGEWNAALLDAVRALARGLDERGLVLVTPGTTATELAARAGRSFPREASELNAITRRFDAVRYLGGRAARVDVAAALALEERIRAARPADVVT